MKRYGGGTIATKIEYSGATGSDTAEIDNKNQQSAVPIMAKLKDAGVTTVVARRIGVDAARSDVRGHPAGVQAGMVLR